MVEIIKTNVDFTHRLIYPGTFNPLHEGHKAIVKAAHEWTGRKVSFEVSDTTFDKKVEAGQIERVSQALKEWGESVPYVDNIVITSFKTFAEKANHFRDSIFLVGYDTLARIADKKYDPHWDTTIGYLLEHGTKFLAFHRYRTDLNVPATLLDVTDFIPRKVYTDLGYSSTEIRRRERTDITAKV